MPRSTKVIAAKVPTVVKKKLTASFFFPSRYIMRGSETKRYPMIAAESVKSEIIAMGTNRLPLSGVLGCENKLISNDEPDVANR
jgi:hypothetical protein